QLVIERVELLLRRLSLRLQIGERVLRCAAAASRALVSRESEGNMADAKSGRARSVIRLLRGRRPRPPASRCTASDGNKGAFVDAAAAGAESGSCSTTGINAEGSRSLTEKPSGGSVPTGSFWNGVLAAGYFDSGCAPITVGVPVAAKRPPAVSR